MNWVYLIFPILRTAYEQRKTSEQRQSQDECSECFTKAWRCLLTGWAYAWISKAVTSLKRFSRRR